MKKESALILLNTRREELLMLLDTTLPKYHFILKLNLEATDKMIMYIKRWK